MDLVQALADINAVLNDPPSIETGGTAAVVEISSRLHACIRRYSPPGSTWREQGDRFINYHAKSGHNPGAISPAAALRGVLLALRRDVEAGRLAQFEEIVHANVYADLLAQASGLHRDGYARAAAVVAGSALEEHIKKLAVKHSISLQQPNGALKRASVLNSELKSAQVYAEPQRAMVEGWQKLRNEAAHGNAGFDGADTSLAGSISAMISGITSLVAQYPA